MKLQKIIKQRDQEYKNFQNSIRHAEEKSMKQQEEMQAKIDAAEKKREVERKQALEENKQLQQQLQTMVDQQRKAEADKLTKEQPLHAKIVLKYKGHIPQILKFIQDMQPHLN